MDGKYILTGGEDDLVQVWSMEDRKVVAWGEGHNSWVSFLRMYTCFYSFLHHFGFILLFISCSCRSVEWLLIHIGRRQIQMVLKRLFTDLVLLVRY